MEIINSTSDKVHVIARVCMESCYNSFLFIYSPKGPKGQIASYKSKI